MKKIVAILLFIFSFFLSIQLSAEQRWCANIKPQPGWQVYGLKSFNVSQGVVQFQWQTRRKGSAGVDNMTCGKYQSNRKNSTSSVGICYSC